MILVGLTFVGFIMGLEVSAPRQSIAEVDPYSDVQTMYAEHFAPHTVLVRGYYMTPDGVVHRLSWIHENTSCNSWLTHLDNETNVKRLLGEVLDAKFTCGPIQMI